MKRNIKLFTSLLLCATVVSGTFGIYTVNANQVNNIGTLDGTNSINHNNNIDNSESDDEFNNEGYEEDELDSELDDATLEKEDLEDYQKVLEALNSTNSELIKKVDDKMEKPQDKNSKPNDKLDDKTKVVDPSKKPEENIPTGPKVKESSETTKYLKKIDKNSLAKDKELDLPDGTYVLDRKDGWVLGDDKGLIQSIIIPKNSTGSISTSKTVRTAHSISVSGTVGFDIEFVSTTIRAGYGFNTNTSSTISVNQSIKAPEDKNLFVKAQMVHRRLDTINVKDNKIVDLASTYIPVSHVLTKLEFETGEKVNQNKLYVKKTYNIFGDQEIDNKHITDKNVSYDKTTVINKNFKHDFKVLNGKSNTVGLYFDVLESGNYSIGSSSVVINEKWYDNAFSFWTGADMSLYKVSDKNEKVLEKLIVSIPTGDIVEDIRDTRVLDKVMPRLEANLQKGEKYLLIINKEKTKTKNYNKDSKFSYQVYFNKK